MTIEERKNIILAKIAEMKANGEEINIKDNSDEILEKEDHE